MNEPCCFNWPYCEHEAKNIMPDFERKFSDKIDSNEWTECEQWLLDKVELLLKMNKKI